MSSLYRMIRKAFENRWMALTALLLTLASCACKLYLPMVMADIVSKGVYQSDIAYIERVGLWMLLICVAMGVFSYFANLASAIMGQKCAFSLRSEIYDHIMALSMDQMDRHGIGSLITRLTVDVNSCAMLAQGVILLVVEPLILMVGGIVMMGLISPVYGLVFAGFAALQLMIMRLFVHSTAPLFLKVRQIMDRMNVHLQNLFLNFRLVKAFNTRREREQDYREVNGELFETAYAARKRSALFNPIIMLVMNLAVGMILYLSGVRVDSGDLNVGLVLSAVTYAEQILVSMVAGGRIFQVITDTKPSSERICSFLDEEVRRDDALAAIDEPFQSLAFEEVGFEHPEGGVALRDISFEISAGEFVALVGATGSGKSILASLCAALCQATGGRVLLNGKNMDGLKGDDVRRIVALTDKQTAILEGTILDNIVFGREGITEEDATEAMEVAQMGEYLRAASDGMRTPIFSMGSGLSGGERERVVIARALAGKPGLLILDDSTSSLDFETERHMLQSIRLRFPDLAVLLITHRLASTVGADRTLVIDHGAIAARGSFRELREDSALYRSMWDHQNGEEAAVCN